MCKLLNAPDGYAEKLGYNLPSRILDAITGFSEIDPLSARRLDKMIQHEIQGLLEAFANF
mgnify:CR=1 FL=1